jgi:hypothetical protein
MNHRGSVFGKRLIFKKLSEQIIPLSHSLLKEKTLLFGVIPLNYSFSEKYFGLESKIYLGSSKLKFGLRPKSLSGIL